MINTRPGGYEGKKGVRMRYNGYDIDFNIYGQNEYSVQYCGDDVMFKTVDEAKAFIDKVNEEE